MEIMKKSKITLNKIKDSKRLLSKAINMLFDIVDKAQERELIFYRNKLNELIDEIIDSNL